MRTITGTPWPRSRPVLVTVLVVVYPFGSDFFARNARLCGEKDITSYARMYVARTHMASRVGTRKRICELGRLFST